jgi:hypothetical protein
LQFAPEITTQHTKNSNETHTRTNHKQVVVDPCHAVVITRRSRASIHRHHMHSTFGVSPDSEEVFIPHSTNLRKVATVKRQAFHII